MFYFFVDESGNFGYAFDAGSSPLFILAFLWIEDPTPLRQRMRQLALSRGLPERHEFNYRKISGRPALLRGVLNILASSPIKIWVLAIDKAHLPKTVQALDQQSFCNFALGRLVEMIPPEDVAQSALVLDDSTEKKRLVTSARIHLSAVMRNKGEAKSFKKVVGHDSHRDPALQCADIVAGLVGDLLTHGKNEYFKLIESKIVRIARFPAGKENPLD